MSDPHNGHYIAFIIDDHPLVAESVAALIRSLRPDIQVNMFYTLKSAQSAIARNHVPTFIISDLSLPDSKGLGTVEQIIRQLNASDSGFSAKRLMVFSGIEHMVLKSQCLALGIHSFTTKSEEIGTLKNNLQAMLLSFAPSTFATKAAADSANAHVSPALGLTLTKKQSAIWQDLAAGYSNAELALRHGVGINTIKTHVKDIFDRVGARNRTEAARMYFDYQNTNPSQ